MAIRGLVYNVGKDERFKLDDPEAARAAHAHRPHSALDGPHLAECWPLLPGRIADRVLALEECTDDVLAHAPVVDDLGVRARARLRHHAVAFRHAHKYVGYLELDP